MPITSNQLTFKRMQTDLDSRVTVFAALDGTLADGSSVEGPWQSIEVELTADEIDTLNAIKARAKTAIAAVLNA